LREEGQKGSDGWAATRDEIENSDRKLTNRIDISLSSHSATQLPDIARAYGCRALSEDGSSAELQPPKRTRKNGRGHSDSDHRASRCPPLSLFVPLYGPFYPRQSHPMEMMVHRLLVCSMLLLSPKHLERQLDIPHTIAVPHTFTLLPHLPSHPNRQISSLPLVKVDDKDKKGRSRVHLPPLHP
jgi:hypothetical protein